MTDLEFIVFLPKLWVPTNFHTGSQELRFIRIFWIFWSCWRQAGWHGVLLVYIVFLFRCTVYCCMLLYTLMIWCNKMWCNVITDIVLCLKIIHLLLYVVPLRIVRFCCCSFLSRSILKKSFYLLLSNFLFFYLPLSLFSVIFFYFSLFLFLKFFLKPITSRFSAFDIRQSIKWVSMLNFRRTKIFERYIWYQSLWLSDNHGSVGYYSLEIESVVL